MSALGSKPAAAGQWLLSLLLALCLHGAIWLLATRLPEPDSEPLTAQYPGQGGIDVGIAQLYSPPAPGPLTDGEPTATVKPPPPKPKPPAPKSVEASAPALIQAEQPAPQVGPGVLAEPAEESPPEELPAQQEPEPAVPSDETDAAPDSGGGGGTGEPVIPGGSPQGVPYGVAYGSGTGGAAHTGKVSYHARLMAHLLRYKRYPSRARRRGLEGTLEFTLTVRADGRLSQYAISKSSGHPALDKATLAMLKRAQPLPPIPPELGISEHHDRFRVSYKLDD
ncbi:MAG: hypothetical protein CSA54_03480 [Gammaproteobacteria bacterium]|nr:MAG: hypothetical protein CSA54_03480 [Gammaproteobacteria bacterium]